MYWPGWIRQALGGMVSGALLAENDGRRDSEVLGRSGSEAQKVGDAMSTSPAEGQPPGLMGRAIWMSKGGNMNSLTGMVSTRSSGVDTSFGVDEWCSKLMQGSRSSQALKHAVFIPPCTLHWAIVRDGQSNVGHAWNVAALTMA